MKLRFQKDDIVNGISIVMKAVPSKTTMSILECILIDASSGEIKLTGNDMELGIETTVNGEILEHGKIALDAKLFPKLPDVYPARMQWLPLNLTINSTQPSAAKILYSISRVVMEMNFPTFLILKKINISVCPSSL